jgi:hypothetical protein
MPCSLRRLAGNKTERAKWEIKRNSEKKSVRKKKRNFEIQKEVRRRRGTKKKVAEEMRRYNRRWIRQSGSQAETRNCWQFRRTP